MVIEVGKEDLISLAEAGRILGRSEKSVYRYATEGVRSADGHALEWVMSGSQMKTSREAVRRFSEKLTAIKAGRRDEARKASAGSGR